MWGFRHLLVAALFFFLNMGPGYTSGMPKGMQRVWHWAGISQLKLGASPSGLCRRQSARWSHGLQVGIGLPAQKLMPEML